MQCAFKMKAITVTTFLLITSVFCSGSVLAVNLPGPMVYVVTPSPRPPQIDEGRSAPFYYHNWVRRMDMGLNATTTEAPKSSTSKVKTPDLIFAEFESDDSMKKSIRKLLEKERVDAKTSTTFQPIYVPDEDFPVSQKTDYGLPLPSETPSQKDNKHTDYFEMYNKLYNIAPAPIYIPTTVPSTTTTKLSTILSAEAPVSKVENIWHIIDSEKSTQYSGDWEEAPVGVSSEEENKSEEQSQTNADGNVAAEDSNEDEKLYQDFVVPGFGTNPGNGAENESRAIRTEPNLRFPYVNLKPFQIKKIKKPPHNILSNSKKNNNLYSNLDNFYDLKNPVRGEAQDIIPMHQPIERYNPAQPYLPQKGYGSNSKQSNTAPAKATANLVPPPPPPSPKLTDNDFPPPKNYESFPPYPPSPPVSKPLISVYSPPRPPMDNSNSDAVYSPPGPPMGNSDSDAVYSPPGPPMGNSDSDAVYSPPGPPMGNSNSDAMYSPPGPPADSSDSYSVYGNDNDGPPMDLGYHYKPPPAPVQSFAPTVPPISKPFQGYNYKKPSMPVDTPMPDTDSKPDFHGYHYDKPDALPPSDYMPPSDQMPPPSYHHHESPPSHHEEDYPELIFQKHHGDDSKGGDASGMDMMPPPPPDMKPDSHGPPMDDSGFPSDFPGDLKYHHDVDDDDFYHHHYHHTTTTTTTTEMPRVNRYSYYYLGKKLYYLPLYFSVYFIVYVGALIIKAVLRHKIVYPNSWRPNDTTAGFFSKRSLESWDLSNENLHEVTGKVTHAIATAAKMYTNGKEKNE